MHELHFQKIPDHLTAALGQDAFGMKLHTLDGQRAVTHAHDHTAVRFRSTSRDGEFAR